MLRALVLLFLLVNAGLYWWLQSDPQALQADREPQRLERQVSPEAIQVLPDLPASAASAASPPASAASFALENAPAALDPGLSVGRFSSRADAVKPLDELVRLGVHGSRVVMVTPPVVQRHLQVHAINTGWHRAVGAQQFDSCPTDAAAST